MKRIFAMLLCAVLLIGSAYAVDLKAPTGIYANSGAFLIADAGQNAIFSMDENGSPVLFAGKINPADALGKPAGGYLDGEALTAQFDTPWDVVSFKGGFVVSDSGNNCLRYIANGKVSTFAGSRTAALTNGAGEKAAFNSPRGLAADGATLYVADTLNNCIRAVDETGNVTTFAGSAEEGYADGSLAAARFDGPVGVCCYAGALYVADTGNHCIRKIENGQVTTLTGGNTGVYEDSSEKAGGYADGWAEGALFRSPMDVAADANGVYIADTGNSAVRMLSKGWVCTFSGEAGGLSQPAGLVIDNGLLYISDKFNGSLHTGSFIEVYDYFADVYQDSWFAENVDFAITNGLFNGVSETQFAPYGAMSRGMIAAVLGRTAQIPDRDLIPYGAKTFSDVPADAYYAANLSWAADNGIISGTGDGSFNPDGNATRQDTVTMLYRLAKVMERDTAASAPLTAFTDSTQVAPYAAEAMSWAVAKGIISGNDQKQLMPTAEITRAEAAKIFSQFAMMK